MENEVTSAATFRPIKMSAAGLSKRYGATTALHPIDLEVRAGELLTLLGPSGSGKTTLLQIISGLAQPSAGELFIDGVNKTHAPAHQRDVGVVFQNYALFPHLTVFENIAFPLQMRRVDGTAIRAKALRALEMVGLGSFAERFPCELSGGQQQRVALARCLVYQPSLVLMDESLSALDRKLRESMQVEIKRIHRETGSTIIFVTHDQDEALALSDRVCLMNGGRIEQIGTPSEIYEHPKSIFVADFIGVSNKIEGRVMPQGWLASADGNIPLWPADCMRAGQLEATLSIRPEYIEIVGDGGYVRGDVVEQIYAGSETRLLIRLASGTVMTARQAARSRSYQVGDSVCLRWSVENARLLEK
nr:ABC transporter ATP-binding protein [Herbaspirillum sp. YR522]